MTIRAIIHQKGFTLIEILLVVIIISTLVALTVPNFSSTYYSFLLKKNAHNIASLMNYAHVRAITRHRIHRLSFDSNFSNYRLKEASDNTTDVFNNVTTFQGRNFIVPPEIKISSDQKDVLFYPDGSIQKIRILLKCKGEALIISSVEQRGVVNVFEFKP